MISFEDFKKMDLRTAKVLEAERVEGSEKLIQLVVDVGGLGERRIVAGIGMQYAPEYLIGKTIVIVANLEPRELMGIESQGMLLAASEGEVPMLLTVLGDVPPGTEIR